MKIKLEYIWLDGNKPQEIRSKTKVIEGTLDLTLDQCPEWSFDGSSTNQAEGHDSDCFLEPVFLCRDPMRTSSFLVLCEVYNADGTPHETNTRHLLVDAVEKISPSLDPDSLEPWFGIEQEYTLLGVSGRPLGFPDAPNLFPGPQGPYYCSVGADRAFGRKISEDHMEACIRAGLDICGTNAEVMPGQWEFQIGPVGPLKVSDQIWIARYLLSRVAEEYGATVTLHPKPVSGDWNGTGAHTNFSTKPMREEGGLKVIEEACHKLAVKHVQHMEHYGEDNRKRMTGKHETCNYDTFKFGNSDRGCSVRIPLATRSQGKGYFEDRRPAANADPYQVCRLILQTTCGE